MISKAPRKIRACQHFQALIDIEGPDFVRHAYVTLLCRKPDPSGRESAEDFLRRGGRKIDLIWSMVTSDEGRRLKCDLPGLAQALQRRWLGQLPLLGWLPSSVIGIEPTGALPRRERAIAFAIAQTHEMIALRLLRVEGLVASTPDPTIGLAARSRHPGASVRSQQIMNLLLARLS